MSGALPGLPQSSPASAARAALAEPLYQLGLAHDPNVILRELQQIVLEVRRRWPEEKRPAPVGVVTPGAAPPYDYVAAPDAVGAAGDALVAVLVNEIGKDGPLTHKSVILHMAIVQTINAVMRHCDGMSPQGYYDGLANGVAQMLAIAPDASARTEFNKSMDVAFEYWRKAGMGAGVNFSDTKGSA